MELFKVGFVAVRLVDIVDITIVAFLFYKLHSILRGSITLRVLGMLLSILLLWKLVELLDFMLLKSILDQVLGLGAIALVILFAPEIRQFFISISKNTILDRLVRQVASKGEGSGDYADVVKAVLDLKASGNGALIVFSGSNRLSEIQETGDALDADISARLIYTIFLKNSPMHDGAMIIDEGKIAAVRCVLPLTRKTGLAPELGLRHMAAIGVTETSDSLAIAVSEERQEVSVAFQGRLNRDVDRQELEDQIAEHFRQIKA